MHIRAWRLDSPFAFSSCWQDHTNCVIASHPPKQFVDTIFEENGFENIRLTSYHCDVNAIEFI
jgi:hypothetical protein